MSDSIRGRIVEFLKSPHYQPAKPRQLARVLELHEEDVYPLFRTALEDLEQEGEIEIIAGGLVALAVNQLRKGEVIGLYSGNKRGFGFLDVKEPHGHPQLYIPSEHNPLSAVSGDIIKARVIKRDNKQPGDLDLGRVVGVIKRAHSRMAGTLERHGSDWVVIPEGTVFAEPILTPDAASKYLKPGTKVIVEITTYPTEYERGQGVIGEVLGQTGEKDVDLRMVLVQFNLPDDFPEPVKDQAREAVTKFDVEVERARRLDLTHEIILTIDPDDAKDYDDAISLVRTDDGNWDLGVHIADVSFFVEDGTPLDVEAQHRGNSTYFPGHVVPMLPEVLSNGVCSLQEAVPRLVKTAFITIDGRTGKPLRTRFANAIIHSRKRLRYVEAQALIDGADVIPHPDGPRKRSDYDDDVLKLLADMNHVARGIQKRRQEAGQLVLDLPKVELKLDDQGRVIDAKPEDDAFTHTLIEMFMVEANEAVARLFDRIGVPFLRRIHPEPDPDASARLSRFVSVAGHRIPEDANKKDLQQLLARVKGRPESFAVNLSVLRSLARAEYSPEQLGHYALSSECYGHFTSPIRRYADLTIHRLLDAIFNAMQTPHASQNDIGRVLGDKAASKLDVPSYDDLVTMGQHLSFTERRSDDAERELRQVKLLELLSDQVGSTFLGVVSGVTKFGLFIQLDKWLVEGLVRYSELLNDYWQLDEKSGTVRGQRTGQTIHVGDVCEAKIVRVDVARRELDVAVVKILARGSDRSSLTKRPETTGKPREVRDGATKRAQRSKSRDKRKTQHRREKK
jgi:ribonuclease R